MEWQRRSGDCAPYQEHAAGFDIPSSFVIRISSFCWLMKRQTIVFNQAMCKHDLVTRNFVTPIAAPVNGSDNQIAQLLMCAHLINCSRCARFRKIIEQTYSRGNTGGLPILWDPAGS